MSKKIYGHKDFFTVFSLVFTGIVILLWLNIGLFWVFIKNPSWKWWFVIALSGLIWIGRRMRRTQKNMYYIFDKHWIIIHLPNHKEYILAKKYIRSQEKIEKLSWLSGRWVKYIPRKQELYFTTSCSHILKITMDDGKVIFISPKKYIV